MRTILCLLLAFVAVSAEAQTTAEWRYIALRRDAQIVLSQKSQLPRYNRAGALGKPEYMTDAFHHEYKLWRHRLETELRQIIGPVHLPEGFSKRGTLNLDICCYRRVEAPDGLRFENTSGDSIVVTTQNLLKLWLVHTKVYKPPAGGMKDDPNFYRWTGASDWPVLKERELPDGAFLASGTPESDTHWLALTVTAEDKVMIAFVHAKTDDFVREAAALAAELANQ